VFAANKKDDSATAGSKEKKIEYDDLLRDKKEQLWSRFSLQEHFARRSYPAKGLLVPLMNRRTALHPCLVH